jgi:Cu2+-containing amine oxidase
MPDAVTETRTILAPRHPLDPLTLDEIRRVAAAARAAHDLGAGMMFETISLSEPRKDVVKGFRPGASFPCDAFVCAFDRTSGAEAHLDLVANRVVDWRHVPGVRPHILFDDITLVGEVARAGPRFRAALPNPWPAGDFGLPDEEGWPLSHTFCWYRTEKQNNPYAHPIEGLCAVVDLDRAENAVCLHEEDFDILWKHTDPFTGEVDVRRARRRVVSSISTVGAYEYGSFWYFHQDGSIPFERRQPESSRRPASGRASGPTTGRSCRLESMRATISTPSTSAWTCRSTASATGSSRSIRWRCRSGRSSRKFAL